ncbi:MAG: DUF6851 domain-containing protein [Pseudomonadota bacterium]
MEDELPQLSVDEVTQLVTVTDETPSISVLWDRAVQEAVIAEAPGPTIASRAYAITHTAIYEAWAAYDPLAVGWAPDGPQQVAAISTSDDDKAEAMSYAAFAALIDLFPDQRSIFEAVMEELGLASNIELLDFARGSPGAIGLEAGGAVLAARATDGSNQENDYADTTGYTPFNAGPFEVNDITRWTPENVPLDPEDANPEQSFLTPQWGTVTPFGFDDGGDFRPEAPEPFFVDGVDATLDIETGIITFNGPDAPAPVAVSTDLIGEVINPGFISQAEEVVAFSAALTDEQKLIAEFWEDGGGTSFPPGTWMTFGQFVSAREDHSLDEDVRLFFALSNAVMDAGIATWEAKSFYDYVRPVRAIRDLGELGLIGELGTDALTNEEGFVIEAWGGPGLGTTTILAENFVTYQTPDRDPSPPFAEYTSGHSAFSAAGAAVLRAFSESDAFGGSVTFPEGTSRFEPGVTPADDLTLAWDTFKEAADEGGLSRLYGGIHFEDGDLNGRTLGEQVGAAAVAEAVRLISGGEFSATGSGETLASVLEIARLYEAILGRRAEFDGLNYWADVEEQGYVLEAIAGDFLSSVEFVNATGGAGALDAASFVDLLFANLELDREAFDFDDTLEADIAGGVSFAAAAVALATSPVIAEETTYLSTLYENLDGAFDFA